MGHLHEVLDHGVAEGVDAEGDRQRY